MVVRMDDPKFGDTYRWIGERTHPGEPEHIVMLVAVDPRYTNVYWCVTVSEYLLGYHQWWDLTNQGNWRKVKENETWD